MPAALGLRISYEKQEPWLNPWLERCYCIAFNTDTIPHRVPDVRFSGLKTGFFPGNVFYMK